MARKRSLLKGVTTMDIIMLVCVPLVLVVVWVDAAVSEERPVRPSRPPTVHNRQEKVMLSIPTSIKMTRKERRRDITVAINNIAPDDRCFCAYPHLLRLDGPGSREDTIDRDFRTLEGRRGPLDEAVRKKYRRYLPAECWEGVATCSPNTWFAGPGSIEVYGEEAAALRTTLTVPADPLEAPNGRYAFNVDVCEYRPPCRKWDPVDPTWCLEPMAGCDACEPENCRQRPARECDGNVKGDCYVWYDSEAFHLQLHKED
ncbi:MAG: hypothetical protein QGG50_00145 [Methanopyri archaeon]|jgi:hypothetical protein|nr:hypothetical protein [Methanopyri archaeon]